jgi:uncharacterized membrane protein
MGDDPHGGAFMVGTVWGLWFYIQIFNVVVLLNFLISYIAEVYSDVYGRDRIDEFKSMAILNNECKTIFNRLTRRIKYF